MSIQVYRCSNCNVVYACEAPGQEYSFCSECDYFYQCHNQKHKLEDLYQGKDDIIKDQSMCPICTVECITIDIQQ